MTAEVKITVVCDNNRFAEGLETGWGFAAAVTAGGTNILFDTGPGGPMLLGNMQKLSISPESIDTVILSHIHNDHTGGLSAFLEKNPNVTVYMPKAFAKGFKAEVAGRAAKTIEVQESIQAAENVYSTGQLGMLIPEQALIINTERGLIIIAACAHAGIIKIIDTAGKLLRGDVLLVMGGFHFEWRSKRKIEKIVYGFRQRNVRYVGACHCTGHRAGVIFRKHFDGNFLNVGAGKTITLGDLQ